MASGKQEARPITHTQWLKGGTFLVVLSKTLGTFRRVLVLRAGVFFSAIKPASATESMLKIAVATEHGSSQNTHDRASALMMSDSAPACAPSIQAGLPDSQKLLARGRGAEKENAKEKPPKEAPNL